MRGTRRRCLEATECIEEGRKATFNFLTLSCVTPAASHGEKTAGGRCSALVLKLAAAAFFVPDPEVRKRAAAVLSSSSHSSRTNKVTALPAPLRCQAPIRSSQHAGELQLSTLEGRRQVHAAQGDDAACMDQIGLALCVHCRCRAEIGS